MEFEEYRQESEDIASGLMELLEPRKEVSKISEQTYLRDVRVYLKDVRGWISRFRQCLAALAPSDSYPCAIIGNQQPVPIDFLAQMSDKVFRRSFQFSDVPAWPLPVLLSEAGPFTFVPKETARGFFQSGLVDFVSGRLANQAKNHAPHPVCGAGVHLTIKTMSSGLEMNFMPQFFGSWAHFDSPTSPVWNCIPASYYFFKAIQWDTTTSRYVQRYQTPVPYYIGGPAQTINFPV